MELEGIFVMLDYLVRQFDGDRTKAVLSLFDRNPDAKPLDCGCSSGQFTLRAGQVVGTSKLFGIEIEEGRVEITKAKGIQESEGDLNLRLPFENESFDCILANHVIEHLDNTDLFLKEIYRILKIGGYTIIATPNLAACYNIFYLMLGKQQYIAMVSDEILAGSWIPLKRMALVKNSGPAHRRVFTLGAFKELLKHHGFVIEKAMGCGFFPIPSPVSKVMSFFDKWHATNVIVKARINA